MYNIVNEVIKSKDYELVDMLKKLMEGTYDTNE